MKSQFEKVIAFHEKFGLEYNEGPRQLSPEEQAFRVVCLREELQEYEDAVTAGDLEEQFDALIDLVYFALGTAHRQGLPFDEGFDIVNGANMLKEVHRAKQRRNFDLEVTKPEGWKSPDLSKLVRPKLNLKGMFTGLVTIDGPDGSGKTTLAKRMVELFGGEYIHLTWSESLEENMDEYRWGALQYANALAQDRLVVLERPWLSNIIYGNVYRGRPHNAVNNWRYKAEAAQKFGILAVPSNFPDWLARYDNLTKQRPELYSDESIEKMVEVREAFMHAYECLPHESGLDSSELLDPDSYVCYDMNSTAPDQLDGWIIETLLGNDNG